MNRMLGKKSVSFLKAVVVFAVALAFFVPAVPVVGVETFDEIVSIHLYTQTVNKGENNTTVSIFPYAQAVKKGETLNVSINVEPREPIVGINVGRLSFDPSILHLNSITKGSLFDPYDTFTPGVINNTDGTVTGISGSTSNATVNPGAFCRISFTAQEEIGTSPLDLEDVVVTNISDVEIPVIVLDGEVAVVWSVTLDFNEYGGKNDYVVFGEAATANDGPPHDSYDTPKAPVPQSPYIRAWFDDGLPTPPYPWLWKDYRHYPDTDKTWDLYAEWESDSSAPTNVTISWDISEFGDCEYDSVILTRYDPSDEEWDFAADMIIEEEYTYAPRWFSVQWLTDHFQINATMDTTPPEITGVTLLTSDPMDTEPDFGWENFTCIVTDNVAVNEVKLVVTYWTTAEHMMTNIPSTDTYYYNTTFTDAEYYDYYVWAEDTSGNEDETTPDVFLLYPNYDVDMNGHIGFWDIMAVAGEYGNTGSNGWIREDVDNSGAVGFWDIMAIAEHYMITVNGR